MLGVHPSQLTGYSLRKAPAACARFRPRRRDEARARGAGGRGRGRAGGAGSAGAPPHKVAHNLTGSVFDWPHKRWNCNDHSSKPERLTGKLRARFLGNHIRCHTQQRAAHQHAWHQDSIQSAALHPVRSTTPVKERCTRSERVHCLPMGCTAPSATSTNAESPTKVQPDRKHSTRSERVEPYRPQPTTTSSSADRRAFLTSTPRPFRARVPGRQEHSARTREAGARHELPAGISGSFTQSRT